MPKRVNRELLVFEALGTDSVQCAARIMQSRRLTLWRNAVMVMRRRVLHSRGLIAGIGLLFSAFAVTVLPSQPTAVAAGVPAGMTQGFSEIVKKVTPAVVNIAVTGAGEGRGRGRKAPLPPGPFGGPPGEEAPEGELPTPPPMPPGHGRPDQGHPRFVRRGHDGQRDARGGPPARPAVPGRGGEAPPPPAGRHAPGAPAAGAVRPVGCEGGPAAGRGFAQESP